MKMILSSCDFRNDKSNKAIMDNLPKSIDKCKLLFIPNEKATYEQIHSDKFVLRMQEFGFIKENITIFDYYNPEQYKHLDIDVLYISGGNTLKTLQRIRNANFDKDIINYINNGVTYIGGSAGAHIVTKDVSHVSKYDEVPEDMEDFSGLGLFDGILICHYKLEREEHKKQLESEGKYKVYTLTDDEYLIIQ